MPDAPMAATSDLIALLGTATGGFHWGVASIGHITIYTPTHRVLGQLSFAGVPIYAAAGGSSMRKTPFKTIESAGQYFASLFEK